MKWASFLGPLITFFAFIVVVSSSGVVAANSLSTRSALAPDAATINDFGGVGALATRTARFMRDGGFASSAVRVNPYTRIAATWQAFPWLEATFRYTNVHFGFGRTAGRSGDELDRGADLKFQLTKESKWIPQIAVGGQDMLGTGLFSSEYVVASKRFYDFDFSVGMGWGPLGQRRSFRNPLTFLSDRFASRNADVGEGGLVGFGNLFSGPSVGLFGSVQWFTPVRGLVLSAEFDGNDYTNEPINEDIGAPFPLNFGLSYQPYSWLQFSGAFERGDTAMFRVSLLANLKDDGMTKFEPPPTDLKMRKTRPTPSASRFFQEGSLSKAPKVPDPEMQRRKILMSGNAVGVRPTSTAELRGSDSIGSRRKDGYLGAVDYIYEQALNNGYDVDSINISHGDLNIYLTTDSEEFIQKNEEKFTQLLSSNVDIDYEKLNLAIDRKRIYSKRRTIQTSKERGLYLSDQIFRSVESEGFSVEHIDIVDNKIQLAVRSARVADDASRYHAAAAVLKAMQGDIKRIDFHQQDEKGKISHRVVLHRTDLFRGALANRMINEARLAKIIITSLQIVGDHAVLNVRVSEGEYDATTEKMARVATTVLPADIRAITLIGSVEAREVFHVDMQRDSVRSDRLGEFVAASHVLESKKRETALAIFPAMEKEGLRAETFWMDAKRASVTVTPIKYRHFARNIGRAARVVSNFAPPSVEEIEVVIMLAGLELARVSVMRRDFEDAVAFRGSIEEIWSNAQISPPRPNSGPFGQSSDDVVANTDRYPKFSVSARPAMRHHIGDPEMPYLFEAYAKVSPKTELAQGLTLSSTLSKGLFGTLDKLERESDSRLPRVRSDIKHYHKNSAKGIIETLDVNYQFQPLSDFSARVTAGLLERMYAGVNAEILYHPFGSSIAIGADIARVRQRGFEQRFDFREYEVTTGHLNYYHKLPWYGLTAEIHAGRFLAMDSGAQFMVSRRFRSGTKIGAWATFTDVPFDEFGEGSFDKGFFISWPLDILLPISTRQRLAFSFRPLTRDGGQYLGGSKRLYGIVEEGNPGNIAQDWNRLLD